MIYLVFYALIGLTMAYMVARMQSTGPDAEDPQVVALAALTAGLFWPILCLYIVVLAAVKLQKGHRQDTDRPL